MTRQDPPRHRSKRAAALALLALSACRPQAPTPAAAEAAAEAPSQARGFVEVVDGQLTLDGAPFRFVGSNFYRLALSDAFHHDVQVERKDGKPFYPQIDATIASYAREGYRVLRLWGFACEGARAWFGEGSRATIRPFVRRDLTLEEENLRQLDFVLDAAGRHGLRVILPLVNYEPEYCGMNWWVEAVLAAEIEAGSPSVTWSCMEEATHHVLKVVRDRAECAALAEPGNPVRAVISRELFYSDARVEGAFQAYVRALLERRNPYSGLAYRDDPAILAIELANEPHTSDHYACLASGIGVKTLADCRAAPQDPIAAGALVHAWLERTSRFVKSIDPNHLVTSGEEGYLTSHDDPGCAEPHAWLHDGSKGADFARNASIPTLDFMTVHLSVDNLAIPAADLGWFDRCVVRDRARLAAKHGKPIIMEEIGFNERGFVGKPQDYRKDRPYYLSRMFRYANDAGYEGVLVWQAVPLGAEGRPVDDDDFTFPLWEIRAPGQPPARTPEGEALRLQVTCAEHLEAGRAGACVYVCPRETPVGADRLSRDFDGITCFLPEGKPAEAQLREGYPVCPARGAPRDAWGWIRREEICQAYAIGLEQYRKQRGCSCTAASG
jgi:mannan endo-1,4-beta-mannosidase